MLDHANLEASVLSSCLSAASFMKNIRNRYCCAPACRPSTTSRVVVRDRFATLDQRTVAILAADAQSAFVILGNPELACAFTPIVLAAGTFPYRSVKRLARHG